MYSAKCLREASSSGSEPSTTLLASVSVNIEAVDTARNEAQAKTKAETDNAPNDSAISQLPIHDCEPFKLAMPAFDHLGVHRPVNVLSGLGNCDHRNGLGHHSWGHLLARSHHHRLAGLHHGLLHHHRLSGLHHGLLHHHRLLGERARL